MRKFSLSLVVLIMLFINGCSDDEQIPEDVGTTEEQNPISQRQSIENQIETLMSQNKFEYKTIIDYDVKGDYIFAVALEFNGGLELALLRNNAGKLEWIGGGGDVTALGDEDSPIAYIIRKENDMDDVKEVRVFGESAKSVIYYEQLSNDFTREVQYWIAYIDKLPNAGDIEYVRK